ncbi:MAG: trehalose-phosphatase [Myxococcales bacterium]
MTARSAILERILALPRPLLLAFDVDGTLAPILDDPAAARVPVDTGKALRRLAGRRGLRVALVTGRDARSLAQMVRVPGAFRAVEHGRVVIAPGQRAGGGRLSREEHAKLDAFEQWVRKRAVPAGGELEVKAAARALHVRKLERRDPDRAAGLLAEAARMARTAGLSPRPGRAVLEAELSAGDKGIALANLVRQTRAKGVMYAGDDLTDRPAIAKASELGGVGLFVKSPERRRTPRGASGALRDQHEMGVLVRELADALAP